MRREGIALVLSAPSGAGKTTLIKRLLAEFPHFGYSVSCTTRQPRQGEAHGKDYLFLSREDFESRRARNYFAEWAEVHGNFYGTPLEPVKDMLRQGQDVLFDIDVQGAAQLKLTLDEAVFVFILPPSMAELERRLRNRGTENEEPIQRRLKRAETEIANSVDYDEHVVNVQVETCADSLYSIIQFRLKHGKDE